MINSFKITSFEKTNSHTLLLKCQREFESDIIYQYIRLQAVNDKIIKVSVYDKPNFPDVPTGIIQPFRWESELNYKENENFLEIVTDSILIRINLTSSTFAWHDLPTGALLQKTEVVLDKFQVEKKVFNTNAEIKTIHTIDGNQNIIDTDSVDSISRDAFHAKLKLNFAENEAVYGLGQHEEGILNYRGHSQFLYQQNMKIAMPVLVSSSGYGILFDTCAYSTFRDDVHGSYFWTDCVEQFDFYFCKGPEFDDIVSSIRKLSGRPSMIPKWAFGFIQSKERYKNQQEIIETALEHRKRQIPLDCIVQDWHYWPQGEWGWKHFDKKYYPNPESLCNELHSSDVKFMISIWPHMRGDNNKDLDDLKAKEMLLADQATYNAFDSNCRKQYWEQADKGLFCYGIDAWWTDCTEPFKGDWQGAVKPEPEERAKLNTEAAKLWLDSSQINAYSLFHSQGIYENQRSNYPEKRVINLTRSGYPGQQRYGTISWSGDIAGNWETLKNQIAEGLNFTVCGNPRWTMDIGGYFIKPRPLWFCSGKYPEGCSDPAYRELFVRWFQLGTFLPMFRSHGTDTPREIWNFGSPGSVIYKTLKDFCELRYRLLPYIYSLAGMEYFQNYTMFRMLCFDFRDDSKVYNSKDQFMFGPSLMVCPVTEPASNLKTIEPENVRSQRKVYLPVGTVWYDFWNGKKYNGGQFVDVEVNIETIPVFVRGGSIIPMGPVIQHCAENPQSAWELHVYPGNNGRFTVYEDAGDGYGYEHDEYSQYNISWSESTSTIKFHKRIGEFPQMQKQRNFEIYINSHKHQSISYNGEEIEI